MAFELPSLPYAHDALEPHIDARTMEIHHGKHHQAYVDNANKALAGTNWDSADVNDVVSSLGDLPDDIRGPVRNNAGGTPTTRSSGKSWGPAAAATLAAPSATPFHPPSATSARSRTRSRKLA